MKSVMVRFQHHHVLSGASCVFIHPSSKGFTQSLASEFHHVRVVEPLPHLHFIDTMSISSILSSSPCRCLFFVDLPLNTEHNIYQNIVLLKNLYNWGHVRALLRATKRL
jgi:hypothetical protein